MIASARADSYRKAIETMLPSPEIDALVVIYIPVDRNDSESVAIGISEGVAAARASGGAGKPVVACLMDSQGPRALVTPAETIPSYTFPEAAAKVFAKAITYAEWRAKPLALVPAFSDLDSDTAKDIVAHAIRSRGSAWLSAEECRAVLSAFRIPQVNGRLARTEAEAAEI